MAILWLINNENLLHSAPYGIIWERHYDAIRQLPESGNWNVQNTRDVAEKMNGRAKYKKVKSKRILSILTRS